MKTKLESNFVVRHRLIPHEFKFWPIHDWWTFHLWLQTLMYGVHSDHLEQGLM